MLYQETHNAIWLLESIVESHRRLRRLIFPITFFFLLITHQTKPHPQTHSGTTSLETSYCSKMKKHIPSPLFCTPIAQAHSTLKIFHFASHKHTDSFIQQRVQPVKIPSIELSMKIIVAEVKLLQICPAAWWKTCKIPPAIAFRARFLHYMIFGAWLRDFAMLQGEKPATTWYYCACVIALCMASHILPWKK